MTTGAAANRLMSPILTTPAQASGLLNTTTTCTNNFAPDIVEKFAFDPGWGHYEVLGLQRWFADDVTTGRSAVEVPTGRKQTTFGWGVGGNVLLPVVPKYLDLQGSVMSGQGIGRYGSRSCPTSMSGRTALFDDSGDALPRGRGCVIRSPAIDIYTYYGQEQNNAELLDRQWACKVAGAMRRFYQYQCALRECCCGLAAGI